MTSSTPGSSGAVPARRTTARTLAPRSASASQARDPTNPLAPVTTTVAVPGDMRPTLARRPVLAGGDQAPEPGLEPHQPADPVNEPARRRESGAARLTGRAGTRPGLRS